MPPLRLKPCVPITCAHHSRSLLARLVPGPSLAATACRAIVIPVERTLASSAFECRLGAAPVVADEELLPRQSLRIDLAAPCEVAVFCVVAVFDSILGHTYQLADEVFIGPNGWESSDKRLARIGRLVNCATAGHTFKGGSHVITGENFPNYG